MKWLLRGPVLSTLFACLMAGCSAAAGGNAAPGQGVAAGIAGEPLRLDVPDAQVAIRAIHVAPRDTDPLIDQAQEPNYVVFPTAPVRGRLFIFLPATGQVPDSYHLLPEQAARNGFHVIDMRYQDSKLISVLCGDDPDPACPEKVRSATIDGADRTPKVDVNPSNSLENRLVKLLAYLEAQYPDTGWGAFLDGSTPKWPSIVVAGHSQGGGLSAFIAKDHEVARVVLFSAPGDRLNTPTPNQPAAWLSASHVTPIERYYALAHMRDDFSGPFDEQWKALGLAQLGGIVNIDKAQPPYGGSHQLVTDIDLTVPNPRGVTFHGSTVDDRFTPKSAAGEPLLAPAWQYLCCS